MAKTVGNLVVKLTAATSPFTKGLKKAGASLKRFGSSIARASMRIAKLGAALAAAAAVGMAALWRSTSKGIDELQKLSQQLGTTVAELQALQHAGAQSGISAEKMRQALGTLDKRLGQAAQGTGQATRALDRLGLSVDDLLGLSPAEKMRRIADAMQGVETAAERASITSDLFSRSNLALVNTLADGSEGLDRMAEEAEKLNANLTDVDANKVAMANDALGRLKTLVSSAAQRFAVELSPFVKAAADKLVDMGTSGEGMGAKVSRAVEEVTVGIANLVGAIEAAEAGFHGLGAASDAFKSQAMRALEGTLGFFRRVAQAVGPDAFAPPDMSRGHRAIADELDKTAGESLRKMDEAWQNFSDGTRADRVREMFAKIRADADRLAQSMDRVHEQQEEVAKFASGNLTNLPKLLLAGSSEAISFRNQQRANQMSGMDKMQRNQREHLNEARKQTGILTGVERAVQQVGGELTVAF